MAERTERDSKGKDKPEVPCFERRSEWEQKTFMKDRRRLRARKGCVEAERKDVSNMGYIKGAVVWRWRCYCWQCVTEYWVLFEHYCQTNLLARWCFLVLQSVSFSLSSERWQEYLRERTPCDEVANELLTRRWLHCITIILLRHLSKTLILIIRCHWVGHQPLLKTYHSLLTGICCVRNYFCTKQY